MADVSYYRRWIINCAQNIVPGIEPTIMERDPWSNISAMDRHITSLLMEEKIKFVQAMKEILAAENTSILTKIMVIEFAPPRGIWDIGPEVEQLDRELPQEPWDYDKLNPPADEECARIDLRGVVNEFLIWRDQYGVPADTPRV